MPRRNDRVHTVERPPQHEAVARLEADLHAAWYRWHHADEQPHPRGRTERNRTR